MAVVDPYSPCPCGSGEKFKWCCHKVESFADRAERLQKNGQLEASLQVLGEGLRQSPDNPWLSMREASILLHLNKPDPARERLQSVVQKNPGHVGAQTLLVRVFLEKGSFSDAIHQLQIALASVSEANRPGLMLGAYLIGNVLVELGEIPSGLAHLELAQSIAAAAGARDQTVATTLRTLKANPRASLWMRNPYRVLPAPPDGLDDHSRAEFARAVDEAERGHWEEGARAFDALAANRVPLAERNLGICRLWLNDAPGAVIAFRRAIDMTDESTDSVDLEALCQLIDPPKKHELVDHVHLIWPVRDHERLLAILKESPSVDDEGTGPMDPEDPNSFEVNSFALLDRPKPKTRAGLTTDLVPRILAHVLVGKEIVALDVFDDGSLEEVRDRFTDLVVPAIPPAHPRTKVLGKVPRLSLALSLAWWKPEDLEANDLDRLNEQLRQEMLNTVWIETPMPFLGGRSPRQVASDPKARVALRAALVQIEQGGTFWDTQKTRHESLRARLGLPEEPGYDSPDLDIDEVHIARLDRIDIARLDDDRLIQLYVRAHLYGIPEVYFHAGKAITERPHLLEQRKIDQVIVYSDLANLSMTRGDNAQAFDWFHRGRQADPLAAANALRWDMLEVRLHARSEPPEKWVPMLAVVLDRYGKDQEQANTLLSSLYSLGVVQLSPNPDRPEEILVDTRPLSALLERYGPKITTASGRLGVSAAQGGIWTPGSESSSSGGGAAGGGLWTPGSASAPASAGGSAEKPRLIIPGR